MQQTTMESMVYKNANEWLLLSTSLDHPRHSIASKVVVCRPRSFRSHPTDDPSTLRRYATTIHQDCIKRSACLYVRRVSKQTRVIRQKTPDESHNWTFAPFDTLICPGHEANYGGTLSGTTALGHKI